MATKEKKQKQKQATVEREAIVNNAPRLFTDFPVGTVSHQGDLIFIALSKLPRSAQPRKNRQLAEGDTQGSRHVCERGKVYDCDMNEVISEVANVSGCQVAPEFIGPVFLAPKNPTEHDLSHPEHGHQGFPAGTVIAVIYQRTQDALDRQWRVVD